MSVEDLEEECRSHDLHWTSAEQAEHRRQMVGMVHGSSHKKELLRLGRE